MPPEDIDDLFRQKLDGHPTPPADDLWARLQAQSTAAGTDSPSPERLDHLFQQGLNGHATTPARQLWERLEDEHLRPKKRRAAAWWPMALAAAVALLLVVGGAGLWLGFPSGNTPAGTVAMQPTRTTPAAATDIRPSAAVEEFAVANNAQEPAANALSPVQQNISTAQATRPTEVASTAPKARMSASEQSPRYLKGVNRRPDAAPAPAPLVARTTTRSASRPASATPADEQVPATKPGPVVASNSKPAPAAEIVPASAVPATIVAAAEIITVDVRNGGSPDARPSRASSVAAAMAASDDRRRLGSRLLQQAGNLVRGERVSLAEAAGLPQNVTVQAVIAGRTLTKSIQL
ncbi:hypothetical protein BEN47_02140 [Hymenobacter lapidarius]|uniref:Uncharacterized protein n=1 Tax=Hymenobacter lapidarius TaxID=1908237 RepID=A0A1G1T2R1_9BACT|nr:hypothetical protein [Hymenobacter lapidarius]OGX85154.1 hypothetical protein BEN47_02140 [Hymenobacter lapidarius]